MMGPEAGGESDSRRGSVGVKTGAPGVGPVEDAGALSGLHVVKSSDGVYRYCLTQRWKDRGEPLVFCLLGPGAPDITVNDPTLRRCRHWAVRLGYSAVEIVNLFGYRATDPMELLRVIQAKGHAYAEGPENPEYVKRSFFARDVVLGWGYLAHQWAGMRCYQVEALARREAYAVYCLKRLRDGSPAHPLRLRVGAALVPL